MWIYLCVPVKPKQQFNKLLHYNTLTDKTLCFPTFKTFDPNFFAAVEIIKKINLPNLKLQFVSIIDTTD